MLTLALTVNSDVVREAEVREGVANMNANVNMLLPSLSEPVCFPPMWL